MKEVVPLVIVNPASRGGRASRDWPSAACALRTHFGAFDCRFTRGRGDAVRIAREESERGRGLVLAFGGDGTISETARGILASCQPSVLGILPHGTGSDFVRSLGIPTRLQDAAHALLRGRTIAIDAGRVVFGDGREKSFVNSASFGLAADVARRVREGRGGYARETVRAACQFDFPEVEIARDDAPARRARITTVSLHNGKYFGGGMKMAPEASVTDGLLDAVVVRKLPLARLVANAPLLYAGAHLGLAEVEHGRLRSLDARAAGDETTVLVEIDGEVDESLPARFEVLPGALRVRVPC